MANIELIIEWWSYSISYSNTKYIEQNTWAVPEDIDHSCFHLSVSIEKNEKYAESDIALEFSLNHWGRVTHISVSKLNIIGQDNGLSPGRRQAIFGTNAEILINWPLETNFSEMLIKIKILSLKNMHVKMTSAKRRQFCLGVLKGEQNYPNS